MRWGRALAVGLILLAGVAPTAARAQEAPATAPSEALRQQAQELLAQGNLKNEQGLYLEALALFERAHSLFPSPKLFFSLGSTCFVLGRTLEALTHYEAFVRGVKREESPTQWALAQRRIFALQGEIATLELQVNVTDASVTADGHAVGRTPLGRPLRFLPGAHAVILARPGYETQVLRLTMGKGETHTRRVTLVTQEEAAATRRAVQQAERQRRLAQDRLRQVELQAQLKRERTRATWRRAAWAGIGTGAALVAAGITCGALAGRDLAVVDHAKVDTLWRDVSANYDRAGTYLTLTAVTASVGVALVAGGTLLLWLQRRDAGAERPRVSALPSAGPRHVGISLAGAF